MATDIAEAPKPKPGEKKAADAPKPGEATSSLLEMMHGDRPKPKVVEKKEPEPPKKPEEEKKPDEAKPAAAKPAEVPPKKPDEKPAATAPVAPVAPVVAAEPNYEKIAEAAAAGTTKALTEANKKIEQPDPTEGLDADEKEMHEAYALLEKEYPDRYKDASKRYVDSLRAADKFEQDWLEKNPGQEFDPESKEYREFLDKNAVTYSDIHLQRAIASDIVRKQTEKSAAKDAEKNKAAEAQKKIDEAAPKIIEHRAATAKEYFARLGDDYKGILDDKGNIVKAEIDRLVTDDPVKAIAINAAASVESFAGDLFSLTSGVVKFVGTSELKAQLEIAKLQGDEKRAYKLQDAIDRPSEQTKKHDFIERLIDESEAATEALPPEQRKNEAGLMFATADAYNKMTPAQRKLHWRYNDKDISDIYAHQTAERSKASIAAEEKRIEVAATKRGYVKNGTPAQGAKPPEEKPAEVKPVVEVPKSPSGIVEQRPALPVGAKPPDKKDAVGSFTSSFLG